MKPLREMKGMIIFFVLLAVVITSSFFVFMQTGPMGIEERFSHAVGLTHEDEHEDEGASGLSLEGNPVLYVIILGVLVVICILAYKYGKF
ncbi:MAG: hypothetical protein WCJ93_01000 [Methanomicrobiales archaeon]